MGELIRKEVADELVQEVEKERDAARARVKALEGMLDKAFDLHRSTTAREAKLRESIRVMINDIQRRGVGAIQAVLEELRTALQKEGE